MRILFHYFKGKNKVVDSVLMSNSDKETELLTFTILANTQFSILFIGSFTWEPVY